MKCWCQRVSQFCTLILSIGISNHSHFGQKIWDQPSTFISYKGSFTNFKADHINHESLLNDWKVQSEINCVSLEQFTDGKWKQGLFHRDVKLVTMILFRSMLNWSKWYSFIAVLNWSKWYTFIAMLNWSTNATLLSSVSIKNGPKFTLLWSVLPPTIWTDVVKSKTWFSMFPQLAKGQLSNPNPWISSTLRRPSHNSPYSFH